MCGQCLELPTVYPGSDVEMRAVTFALCGNSSVLTPSLPRSPSAPTVSRSHETAWGLAYVTLQTCQTSSVKADWVVLECARFALDVAGLPSESWTHHPRALC